MYNSNMNVYDFDDTIYDGESALDFFISYMKENPSMLRYMPKVLFAMLKYKLGKITTEQMMRDYAPLIKKIFCKCENREDFVSRFWDGHMHKIKGFYDRTRREDDIILTASPDITMNEIAKRLGIKNLVCSKIDNETGEITRLCMRQNKITSLFEDFGDVEIDDFYTDSIKNDKFIADKAKHVYIVKGEKITKIR